MYRKILVAFGGSPESRLAVEECSHLMQVSGREIHLVCVLHDPSPYLLAVVLEWRSAVAGPGDPARAFHECFAIVTLAFALAIIPAWSIRRR